MPKKNSCKKVLALTYNFPPLGGSGVQRVLKFCKYLRNFGWEPVVLTVKNLTAATSDSYDRSLTRELPREIKVFRAFNPTFEKLIAILTFPFRFTVKIFGLVAKVFVRDKDHFKKKIIKIDWKIRNLCLGGFGAFFLLPDGQAGWIPFAFFKALRIVREEKIDLIYANSPPATVAALGFWIKIFSGKPLVVDYRDPWTQNPHRPKSKLFYRDWLDRRFEKLVNRKADFVVANTTMNRRNLIQEFKLKEDRVVVITNGYDESDFVGINFDRLPSNRKLTIAYSGYFYHDYNPRFLLEALSLLVKERPKVAQGIRLDFIGDCNVAISMVERLNLGKYVSFIKYLPHKELLCKLRDADVLYLASFSQGDSDYVIPGKLFEYFRAKRFIFALYNEESVVCDLIKETGTGKCYSTNNVRKIKNGLEEIYKLWSEGKLNFKREITKITPYERRELTKRLAGLFDKVLLKS